VKVEILGTRAHIEDRGPGHMLRSGVLIDDVLFDLGEAEYLERDPQAIFLTHLHADHAFFVDDPHARIDVPLYGPQPFPGQNVRPVRSMVHLGDMRVTPVPTDHSRSVSSCGFLVEKDLGRVLYTGDLLAIQDRYRDRLADLDAVITDGSFIRTGGLVRRDPVTGRPHGHTGMPDLVEMFAPVTPLIVFTHLGSWFFKDLSSSTARVEALSTPTTVVRAAHDGMTMEFGTAI
jgi:phosphoribosyl 1,2-cyclic phosphodiesterase